MLRVQVFFFFFLIIEKLLKVNLKWCESEVLAGQQTSFASLVFQVETQHPSRPVFPPLVVSSK